MCYNNQESIKVEYPTYKIIIDNGCKPYMLVCKDLRDLKEELQSLNTLMTNNDYPYFEIVVLDINNIDITNTNEIKDLI